MTGLRFTKLKPSIWQCFLPSWPETYRHRLEVFFFLWHNIFVFCVVFICFCLFVCRLRSQSDIYSTIHLCILPSKLWGGDFFFFFSSQLNCPLVELQRLSWNFLSSSRGINDSHSKYFIHFCLRIGNRVLLTRELKFPYTNALSIFIWRSQVHVCAHSKMIHCSSIIRDLCV